MATLHTYLNFNGYTEEVFNFYKSVFQADFVVLQRFRDIPGNEDVHPEEAHLIMHVCLPIGDSLLMGTDVPKSMPQVEAGTNMSISLSVDSREEADRVFKELSAGGTIHMPIQNMFWGDYFGMLTDKYAIQWMVNFAQPQPL